MSRRRILCARTTIDPNPALVWRYQYGWSDWSDRGGSLRARGTIQCQRDLSHLEDACTSRRMSSHSLNLDHLPSPLHCGPRCGNNTGAANSGARPSTWPDPIDAVRSVLLPNSPQHSAFACLRQPLVPTLRGMSGRHGRGSSWP